MASTLLGVTQYMRLADGLCIHGISLTSIWGGHNHDIQKKKKKKNPDKMSTLKTLGATPVHICHPKGLFVELFSFFFFLNIDDFISLKKEV